MRFCPSSKRHRIVLVLNGTSCDDIDDSVNDDAIVVHLTMIEAIIYAVLEEWNWGNNDTMLDIDLDVDPIVHAIKDGRRDNELKSRGPTVEVVSLRLRCQHRVLRKIRTPTGGLCSPSLVHANIHLTRIILPTRYYVRSGLCVLGWSSTMSHNCCTRSTKQSSDIGRLVRDCRDGVRRRWWYTF